MGIVSRMFKPKAISTDMERMIRESFGGGVTSSGATVSNETAMRHATVYSCVHILSRTIGMLPCHMMEKVNGTKNIAENFYLYPLLHDMPNEWMTSIEFWGMCINHLSLRGNFFALKNRGINRLSGQVLELLPLAPDVVQEVVQSKSYGLTYKCRFPDGSTQEIPGSEIMHLKGMTSNGYMGINPIQYIRESIGLGLATEEFGSRYFGSGTHPSMIVEHPGKLSATASQNLKSSLNEKYSGLGKSHRLLLLEEGMKAQAISINPEDSQFLDTRKYQKADIVDIFLGTPLTIMNSGDSTPTFASAEQFSIGFIVYSLMPWIVTIEKAIYRDLLTIAERKKYYAKFKVEGLKRGALKEQMEAFAIGIDKCIFSPNEVRAMLDYNSYGAEGDIYRTRTSTTKEATTNKELLK